MIIEQAGNVAGERDGDVGSSSPEAKASLATNPCAGHYHQTVGSGGQRPAPCTPAHQGAVPRPLSPPHCKI